MTDAAYDWDVPASTHIRRKSVPNCSTVRLLARLEHLRDQLQRSHEWAEQKGEFKHRVMEALRVEAELCRRGVSYVPVSRYNHLLPAG